MNSATSVFSSPRLWFLFRLLMRRLHLIRDVEHAHSPGIDVAISDYRDLSGCGLRLDVLGNRAEDVQAASDSQAIPQERSRRIGGLDQRRALSRTARDAWRLPSPAIIRNFPKNCDY
ncbi:hypothetical protein [Bradyrhizobium sp. 170]|uniref:hypothetical protein n=1 Tax=Bradyrhizobium sp. 170 TaxID=2782641 RepID=UPI001FFF4DE2|nr:hypothetical protein [Bradyrhizobium sp. 170]UPK01713.1 hypothetical protein IVB05_29220 [Bradyrhizobium sp. 170]